jgi:hypothetical protein
LFRRDAERESSSFTVGSKFSAIEFPSFSLEAELEPLPSAEKLCRFSGFGGHPYATEGSRLMTRSSIRTWFAWFAFLGLCPLLLAQSSGGQDTQSGVNPGGTVTNPLQIAVTGCLKREARGGYYIADKNGTTWNLVPSDTNLAEHVNHSVMITGKPATNAEQQGGKLDGGGKPQVDLRVLTVKTLSLSCAD